MFKLGYTVDAGPGGRPSTSPPPARPVSCVNLRTRNPDILLVDFAAAASGTKTSVSP